MTRPRAVAGRSSAAGVPGGFGQPGNPGEPGRPHVLIVTDQPLLVEVISLTLTHGSVAVWVTPTVEDAVDVLERGEVNLVVLDMDVEGLGSDRVLERLGAGGHVGVGSTRSPHVPARESAGVPAIPVIALTRRGDLKTKLAAFERGVDDVLSVPFSPEELLARTLAVLRRTYRGAISFSPMVRVGELEIDIYHRKVRAGASELHLTPLEQNLLYLLAANAGRVLTRDEIMDHLWGVDYIADSNVVDRHVRNLRAKLQNDWRRPRFVATVPGRGYRFTPVSDEKAAGGAKAAGGPPSS